MDSPNFVAKRSGFAAVTVKRVVFFWLIIPLIVMIVDAIIKSSERVYFYDNYLIHKKGILGKDERKIKMTGIIGLKVKQRFMQRIFNRGNVRIEILDNWDINITGLKRTRQLKEFLNQYITSEN